MFGFNKLTTLHGEGDFKNAFIKALKSLKKGQLMTIVGGEGGFGLKSDVYKAIEKAIRRGVSFEIFLGPRIMIKDSATNQLIDLIIEISKENLSKDKNSQVTLYVAKDNDYEHTADFHFATYGLGDLLVEYPHLPSQGLDLRQGFQVKRSTDIIIRLDIIIRELRTRYRRIDFHEGSLLKEYFSKRYSKKADLLVIEKEDEKFKESIRRSHVLIPDGVDPSIVGILSEYEPVMAI